jgi:oligopeptide/dipeptide ABC transporter ATP-binding protein
MSDPVLVIRNLTVRYRGKENTVYAVEDAWLRIERGQVLALVGESGSGKTTVAMSIPRLLPMEGEVLTGDITFDGRDLTTMSDREMRSIRGNDITVIFQDPVAGLNPVISIEDQVAEMLTNHLPINKKEARRRTVDILARVGLSDPDRVAKSYPFQLSGGMCQRVMVGIATALDPHLIIADEPTSSLDVTIQAQILAQLDQLRRERGTSILLITHDFGVVASIADYVAVMYAGRIVETGTPEEVMGSPLHPYTAALLASLPRLDGAHSHLASIPGSPPEMHEPSEHCPFLPRCSKAMNECRTEQAPLLRKVVESSRQVACYNPIWQG